MRISLILLLVIFNGFICRSQSEKFVNDAYVITVMASKFHFQPKALNDSFSASVFKNLLEELDENKLFFTNTDFQILSKLEFSISGDIKNKKGKFLSTIASIYKRRIHQADSIMKTIASVPFNFALPEKVTKNEIENYSTDEKSLQSKLYKYLKTAVLFDLLRNDSLKAKSVAEQKKYIDSSEKIFRLKELKIFERHINYIQNQIGGINQVVGNEYCKAIAKTYDPHTNYFPQDEKDNFDTQLGQKTMAFGFTLNEEKDGTVTIDNINPGSPAFKSGQLNKGDKLESVQWKGEPVIDVSKSSLKDIIDVLDISNHSAATFTIRKADNSLRKISLLKEKSDQNDDDNKVKSFILKGSKNIGFISLPAFYEDWESDKGIKGCANDVAKEILKLKRENIEALILDLRFNGGGSMEEAIQLSGLFIDAGPVGQNKLKDSKIETLKDVNRGTVFEGPLVVLVNGQSASASEMTAGTLQDYNRAVIIGSNTYGKATAQVVLPMDTTITVDKDISQINTSSYLKTTMAELFRVTGKTAQGIGVIPDIQIPDLLQINPEHEKDERNVLETSPIEPCKYFTPYPKLSLATIQTTIKNEIDTIGYFKYVTERIQEAKNSESKKEIDLNIFNQLNSKKIDENKEKQSNYFSTNNSFKATNNSFEQQELNMNEEMKELNAEWITFLEKDRSLQIAYDTLLLMLKK